METKPHILYVDDEAQNLLSFRAAFRRYYEIHTAQSGEEALSLLKTGIPAEVIVSDQRMPTMSGSAFFGQVKALFPAPIRMLLTGYSDMQSTIDAINQGNVYYYISKPWKHEELKLVLDKGIETYRLTSENQSLRRENQDLQLLAEQQEKARILAQFETLKNQVNPHFLFNSLNVLSAIVHDDPDLAESFISGLTRVYRYVLELKEEDLVSLDEELNFINSFIFLHQIRFGNSLQIYTQVEDQARDKRIPPLTLQLLVENAIKHNIISREQPLTIELYTEGDWFVVRNKYQPRAQKEHSTGLGLDNLRGRYRMLSERQPIFLLENEYYLAKAPLLPEVRLS